MQHTTVTNAFRWIVLGALFLITIAPLIVSDYLFFPFITGKAFFFRILIEIAFGGWIVLALLDKAYRPRFSWIGVVVLAFVGWMLIADSFAPNAAKAFWSNFERMEGWVLLIHLLGFFFAASNVLRVGEKWRAWFITSLGVSAIVSLYALLQLSGGLAIHQGSTRIDATFGNSAYFAIYLLFNVCIAAWLAVTEQVAWMRYSLYGLAVVGSILIVFTETRGTVIAFVIAVVLSALLTALTAGKRARTAAIGVLTTAVVVVGSLYLARDSDFVQHNSTLQRITSISVSDGATRFTLWGMAWQGVLDRPIVGWGQEGFNYVFNTYYKPSLYHQEPWFDRAHNTFIDWLVAGGFPAFVLYLSLFVTVLVLLWRRASLSRAERVALTAAIVGYAIHNLFVFDNLYSYIYFFALLALVDSQVARPIGWLTRAPTVSPDDGATVVAPIAIVILSISIWMINVPGMRVASTLITALSAQDYTTAMSAFTDLAKHPSFAAQEIREQLIGFASSAVQNTSLTSDEKQRAATLAVTEMQKQIASYPRDAREHLQLAYLFRSFGDADNALKEMQIAHSLSPKKIDILLTEGAIAWDSGDAKTARSLFATAYALAPQFTDLAAYAAAGELAVGNSAAADAILERAYGTTTVDSSVLATAYYRAKAWPRLIALWKMRATPSASVETWFSLAAAYYAAGEVSQAADILRSVVKQHPEAASSVDAALKQILGTP